ncbi:ilvB operon leader peptide IvbL [Lonsdalea populi]|uniref:IlvB operon leader peptide IvbL n=1 Tax=Lonsdalea populi TaxID=1172565 RepID=A0A3N0UQP3_9GAMM|nr:ilvB operon leader peptide IvbL [Lonsdalea populi]QPQ24667.1 ilvB operon leader peptide IvbL [Lonsdalea populi]ROH80918.1 ilvB operon leader peptide IvbL [Lonsdalea populi]ROH82900.1 ilvB operon leader peptide IvbL [Lonsdalea populi]ROH83021.1 ilvB operon leader peptide IvbL [Lonsdalea populi]
MTGFPVKHTSSTLALSNTALVDAVVVVRLVVVVVVGNAP